MFERGSLILDWSTGHWTHNQNRLNNGSRKRGTHKKGRHPMCTFTECWEVYFWEVQPPLLRWLFGVRELISIWMEPVANTPPTAAGRWGISLAETMASGTKSWFSLVFVVPARKIIRDGMHMAPRSCWRDASDLVQVSPLRTARAHFFLNRFLCLEFLCTLADWFIFESILAYDDE